MKTSRSFTPVTFCLFIWSTSRMSVFITNTCFSIFVSHTKINNSDYFTWKFLQWREIVYLTSSLYTCTRRLCDVSGIQSVSLWNYSSSCYRRFNLGFKPGIKSLHLLFRHPGDLSLGILSLEILTNLSATIIVLSSSHSLVFFFSFAY